MQLPTKSSIAFCWAPFPKYSDKEFLQNGRSGKSTGKSLKITLPVAKAVGFSLFFEDVLEDFSLESG